MYREELELPDLSVLEDEMSQLVVEDDASIHAYPYVKKALRFRSTK